MVRELVHFWGERQDDLSVKVIVTKGAGEKGFCSGMDLKEFGTRDSVPKTPDNFYQGQSFFSETLSIDARMSTTHYNGCSRACLWGGLSLALASDVRIASEDAVFLCPNI